MASWRRKSFEVDAELLSNDKASMYRMCAWIIDRSGKAWIEDGYDVQGPDLIHLKTVDDDDSTLLPGMWVTYREGVGFKALTQEKFEQDYEVTPK